MKGIKEQREQSTELHHVSKMVQLRLHCCVTIATQAVIYYNHTEGINNVTWLF